MFEDDRESEKSWIFIEKFPKVPNLVKTLFICPEMLGAIELD